MPALDMDEMEGVKLYFPDKLSGPFLAEGVEELLLHPES
jgi:hypothetical protein